MIRRKIAQLMIGRYGSTGIDKFGIFLLIVALLLNFIAMFFSGFVVTAVLRAAQILLTLYFFFRLFSRNFAARRKENRAFTEVWGNVKKWFKLQFNRLKDIKHYRYRKCPSCKAVLKLPAKKGEHTVRCPRCGERFGVKNIF